MCIYIYICLRTSTRTSRSARAGTSRPADSSNKKNMIKKKYTNITDSSNKNNMIEKKKETQAIHKHYTK